MERSWLITDSASSFATTDFHIRSEELGLGSGAFCRKTTLSGGRQAGVELLELSTGTLSLRVCPTRGMGIIDGSFAGHFLGALAGEYEMLYHTNFGPTFPTRGPSNVPPVASQRSPAARR